MRSAPDATDGRQEARRGRAISRRRPSRGSGSARSCYGRTFEQAGCSEKLGCLQLPLLKRYPPRGARAQRMGVDRRRHCSSRASLD
eukprot:1577354-Pyramimonas_sp.AAC.1